MTALHDPSATSLSKDDLDDKCNRTFSNLPKIFSPDQLKTLETVTKEQSDCAAWHTHRKGRITASKVGIVCSATDLNQIDSVNDSLMGYSSTYDTDAMKWGREHEAEAIKKYVVKESPKHDNLKVCESGLVVPHSDPYLGGSPDALLSCNCCGQGVLEVKCPYKYRKKLVNFENDDDFVFRADMVPKKTNTFYYH